MTHSYAKELGKKAEGLAEAFFIEKGYHVLERNYRVRCGEIDLILEDRLRVIFVEVKSRVSAKYGLPQEAITYHKKRQIIRVAKWYLQEKGCLDREIRFDVLAIRFHGIGKPTIEHIPWAFDLEE
ncbi:MAG: YraN family protein [Deltaproteobacteria bacterium]|nr:YraN family protein [Deltaproteobacteria bacterium]MDL1960109.1 YraN family protein [Deltaproteobacteria bacterium]